MDETFIKFKKYVECINLYTTTLNSLNFAYKQQLIDQATYNTLRYALTEYINSIKEEIENDRKQKVKEITAKLSG